MKWPIGFGETLIDGVYCDIGQPVNGVSSTVNGTDSLPDAERGKEWDMGNGNGKGEVLEPAPEPQHPLNYARKMVEILAMPETTANLRAIEAAITAESSFTGMSLEDTSQALATAAMNARRQGVELNKFWFEDTKWRNGNGKRASSKAQQHVDEVVANCEAAKRMVRLDH
jgi:hypothetical protein